jgi:hypothetical protein
MLCLVRKENVFTNGGMGCDDRDGADAAILVGGGVCLEGCLLLGDVAHHLDLPVMVHAAEKVRNAGRHEVENGGHGGTYFFLKPVRS